MTKGSKERGKGTAVPGDITVSTPVSGSPIRLYPGYETTPTSSCSDAAGKAGRVPQMPRPRNIEDEDRVICMRLGRSYTEDVPYRATFFEKLDFFLVSDDVEYTKYLSIIWPRTKITYDKMCACYIVELDVRKNRLEELIFCTIEEMVSARFSGEIVLS
jgi:hypothetical protein